MRKSNDNYNKYIKTIINILNILLEQILYTSWLIGAFTGVPSTFLWIVIKNTITLKSKSLTIKIFSLFWIMDLKTSIQLQAPFG